MTIGKLYRHARNSDVAMMPLTIGHMAHDPKVYNIRCRWFNIVNSGHVFEMGVVDDINIKIEDLPKWREYVPKK